MFPIDLTPRDIAANATANVGELLRADCTLSPIVVDYPPSPAIGDIFGLKLVASDGRNTASFPGGASLVIPGERIMMQWDGIDWGFTSERLTSQSMKRFLESVAIRLRSLLIDHSRKIEEAVLAATGTNLTIADPPAASVMVQAIINDVKTGGRA